MEDEYLSPSGRNLEQQPSRPWKYSAIMVMEDSPWPSFRLEIGTDLGIEWRANVLMNVDL
jgi:hypothetical protein